MKADRYRFDGTHPCDLRALPCDGKRDDLDKQKILEKTARNLQEMAALQDGLYADGREGVIFVLQALDAAGKDSTIKHVMGGLNPQGVQVTSFKQPGSEELTAREEMYRQRFYLYLSLTKPSEGLFLSFCKADAGGQPLLPSYLAGVILGLFPALKIRDLAAEQHKTRGLETPAGIQERFPARLCTVFWREGRIRLSAPCITGTERIRRENGSVPCCWRLLFLENHTSGIGRAAARALYGKVLANSATRLELFSSCACAHFLRYGLNLQERVRYEFTPADMGTVIHQALECFSRKLEKRGLSWRELSDEFRESAADESLEEITGDYGNTILHSSSRGAWQIQRIRRILRRTVWVLQEQIRRGRFDPEGAEIAFSMREGLSALQVALSEDETLLLKGRIDRLDVCREEDRLYLRIVDYKTGSTSMDLNLLLEGLQLQLAVYLSAALELEQRKYPDLQAEPAGMYYYRVGDPLIPGTPGESREEIRRKILDALKLDGLSRWEGEILSLLDEELISAGKSSVIPVSFKKDGALSRTSRAAGEEQFSGHPKIYRKENPGDRQSHSGRTDRGPALPAGAEDCLRLLPLPGHLRI